MGGVSEWKREERRQCFNDVFMKLSIVIDVVGS